MASTLKNFDETDHRLLQQQAIFARSRRRWTWRRRGAQAVSRSGTRYRLAPIVDLRSGTISRTRSNRRRWPSSTSNGRASDASCAPVRISSASSSGCVTTCTPMRHAQQPSICARAKTSFRRPCPRPVEQILDRELLAEELPAPDLPERDAHDRAPDPDRPPAPERQCRRGSYRLPARADRRRPWPGRADGPQGGDAADRQGRGGAEVRPDHRLRDRRHPARRARPRPQLRDGRATTRTTTSASTTSRSNTAIRAEATFKGSPPRRRPRRHAQLHRALLDRELLGDRDPPHRRPVNHSGMLAAYPHIDGVDRAFTRHRLRHGRRAAKDSTLWSACSGATPRIRTLPPRSSSGSAARSCRSAG